MAELSEILIPIIQKAGKKMRSAYDVEEEGAVSEKYGDPANLVTVYDVAIQDFIIKEIKECFPDAYFISEEKENDSEHLSFEYCFVIDPIDGTANFIHQYNHSCISLAMISKNEVVFAAVYDPYLDEIFAAEKGKGAFLNGRPMRVSSRDVEHSILAYGTAPYRKNELGEKTFSLAYKLFMQCSDVRRCGSAALDLAYLAAGRNDMFFELMLSPWDIAAGVLLVKEAGGIISDTEGQPIDLSRPCPVIAGTPTTYSFLLKNTK